MPAYPENVRFTGADRKSLLSGQTDANDPSGLGPTTRPALARPPVPYSDLNGISSNLEGIAGKKLGRCSIRRAVRNILEKMWNPGRPETSVR
jgi:hypothetical protein